MHKKFRVLCKCLSFSVVVLLTLCSTRPLQAQVNVALEPPNVVSHSVAADEIISELYERHDSLNKILALSKLADSQRFSLVSKKTLETVKTRFTGSLEQLLQLNPDIVFLSSFNQPEVVEQIKRMKVKTHTLQNANSIEEIINAIHTIGGLTNTVDTANNLINEIKNAIKPLKAVKLQTKQGVLCITTDLTVAGDPSPINDVIELAGGISVARQSKLRGWFKIGEEALFELNPDVLVIPSSQKKLNLNQHNVLKELKAVKSNQIIFVDDALLFSQSHHIVKAIPIIRSKLDSFSIAISKLNNKRKPTL